jgi:hypothetical protein
MTQRQRHVRTFAIFLCSAILLVFALVVALNTLLGLDQNRLLHQVIPPDIDVLIKESAGDNEKLLSLILSHEDSKYGVKREELAAVFLTRESEGLWLQMPDGFETNWYDVTQRCWDWGRVFYIPWSFYKLPGQWWRFGSQVCAR